MQRHAFVREIVYGVHLSSGCRAAEPATENAPPGALLGAIVTELSILLLRNLVRQTTIGAGARVFAVVTIIHVDLNR